MDDLVRARFTPWLRSHNKHRTEGRDELLFRDYLVADSAVRDKYSALKRDLVARWHDDRRAYTEAKTAFVLDTLERARIWAIDSGWNAPK
jgi:GrpB-like predicted nucleotidyltransferase (UPF0157 family)